MGDCFILPIIKGRDLYLTLGQFYTSGVSAVNLPAAACLIGNDYFPSRFLLHFHAQIRAAIGRKVTALSFVVAIVAAVAVAAASAATATACCCCC